MDQNVKLCLSILQYMAMIVILFIIEIITALVAFLYAEKVIAVLAHARSRAIFFGVCSSTDFSIYCTDYVNSADIFILTCLYGLLK